MDSIATITSDDNGKTYEVPESCIGNASDARQTVTTFVKAEETRSKRRQRVNGMLNGNPPWPSLIAKGQGERANFTQREAEGFVAAAKTPYYALAFKTDRFIQLTIDYGNADLGLLNDWAAKIATRYQYALDDWDGLDIHMQRSQFQMIVHGSGPMVWEDAEDWRSSSRMAGQMLLPDDASADIDDWETAACVRSYLPSALWKIVQKEDAATARGWNVPEVKRAIMLAAPEDVQQRFLLGWEHYEAELRKGVTGFDSKSKRIFVADLFQKEFSNRISHFIILQTSDADTRDNLPDPKDPISGFLFRKIDRFECFDEIVCPFLYDVGPDGQWHSVKGAGPKIFDFCSVSDRLNCRALDGAMKASGIVVKAKDVKSLSEAAFSDVTGGTVIGPGFETEQQRVAPNLESPLLMKREQRETLSNNTGQYRAHLLTDEHAPTLGQEQMTAQAQNVLADGDASRYYRYLDRFHRETFRRMLEMGEKLFKKRKNLAPSDIDESVALTPSEKGALKFYRNCVVADQIPEAIMEFSNFCRIKAKRIVGNGSAQMQTMIGEKLLGMVTLVNERGRNFIVRNQITNLAGPEAADAIEPLYDTPQQADSHISVATLENNFLRLPDAQVEISPEQDHVVHFAIHFQFIGEQGQKVQAGQVDPHAFLVLLEQAGPHTHEHLQAIASDPTRKDQVAGMQKAWMAMSKTADQLAQQVQAADEAAKAQQPQQQPDPKLIAMLAEVKGSLDIKMQKMLMEMQLKKEKQQFALQQQDAKTAHTMRLKNVEAVHGARLEDMQATHAAHLDSATAGHAARLDSVNAAHDRRLSALAAVSDANEPEGAAA